MPAGLIGSLSRFWPALTNTLHSLNLHIIANFVSFRQSWSFSRAIFEVLCLGVPGVPWTYDTYVDVIVGSDITFIFFLKKNDSPNPEQLLRISEIFLSCCGGIHRSSINECSDIAIFAYYQRTSTSLTFKLVEMVMKIRRMKCVRVWDDMIQLAREKMFVESAIGASTRTSRSASLCFFQVNRATSSLFNEFT